MKLSKRASRIQLSHTRKLFDLAKKYEDVIDFTLGDPDYMTPNNVKDAAINAIRAGKTKYSDNRGLLELREVVAEKIYKESNVNYDATSEIMISVGAMEALYLTLCSVVDEGDEVIIPSPYWVNYEHMVLMCDGIPVIVDSEEENDFVVRTEDIKGVITDKTVAIILNSPSNPTGMVYDKNSLKEICQIAKEKDILIIWDECYKSILFDGKEFVSVLDFEGMKDNAVIINSCSKKFSMTGWRVGYAAAPAELVGCMAKFQENIAACASLPSQYAAIEAIKNESQEVEMMRNGFERRRNILVEGINGIDGLSCKCSKGTFYVLVNIKATKMDSVTFAYRLLEEQKVAVVPGITYGKCCDGYVRIACTMDECKIQEGIRRIETFINSLTEEK